MPKPRHLTVLPLLAALFVGAALLPAPEAAACPNCKAAVPDTAATDGGAVVGADMAKGYFWSILFMMGMPMVLAGTAGTALYVTLRRSAAAADPDNRPQ